MAKETTTIHLRYISYLEVFNIHQYLYENDIECTISCQAAQNEGGSWLETYRYNFAESKDATMFALKFCPGQL